MGEPEVGRRKGETGGRGGHTERFPVIIARGIHLFPYRTQKLSLLALMVLGWKRPGRVVRRRDPGEGEKGWRSESFSNTPIIREKREKTEGEGTGEGTLEKRIPEKGTPEKGNAERRKRSSVAQWQSTRLLTELL